MFAVIYIPDFYLQAALRPQPENHARPIAIVDGVSNKPLIVQATQSAIHAGVHSGMSPTQGQARCPALVIKTRSFAQETAAAKALVHCALGVSPYIEATAEDICTIDLRGNPILGDVLFEQIPALEAWAGKILHTLAQLNLAGQVGIARTPLLALHAARAARPILTPLNDRQFLDELPIDVLEPSQAVHGILKTWGIHTVGTFVALGKENIIDRLGNEGMASYERAVADSQRPLQIVTTPEVFEEAIDFECEVETVQPLLFVLKRFIEQISIRLESVYLVAEELTFRLIFKQGKDHECIFKVPAPTRKVATLFRLIDTHLETLRADHPIVGLRLSAKPARPAHQQFNLFEAALRDPNQFYQTLARLTGLVGSARVGVPVPQQTHRPDSFHLDPVGFEVRPRNAIDKTSPPTTVRTSGLALRRFRPPLSAQVQLNAQRPIAVKITQGNRHILDASGPWKNSGDWWSDRPWSREEWDVQTSMGEMYRLVCQDEQWFVEGIYD